MTQYAAFAERQRAEILKAIEGDWAAAVTTNATPTDWNYASVIAAFEKLKGIAGSGLTSEGKPITLPVSEPAPPPPGTIGDEDVSQFPAFTNEPRPMTPEESEARAEVLEKQKAEAAARIAAERFAAVKALARTFMGEARKTAANAFRIMPGRRVEFVGAIGMTRVPFGTYTVVTHTVHGSDGAVLSLRAARPRTPGGKLDPQIFPRVPVNAVNPVPEWDVFPRGRYGRLADYLPGVAAGEFTTDAWRMLADVIDTDLNSIEWQGGGWAIDPKHASRFADEFAAAIRALCDDEDKRVREAAAAAERGGRKKVEVYQDGHPSPFGRIHITAAVNLHNHHPKKVG